MHCVDSCYCCGCCCSSVSSAVAAEDKADNSPGVLAPQGHSLVPCLLLSLPSYTTGQRHAPAMAKVLWGDAILLTPLLSRVGAALAQLLWHGCSCHDKVFWGHIIWVPHQVPLATLVMVLQLSEKERHCPQKENIQCALVGRKFQVGTPAFWVVAQV